MGFVLNEKELNSNLNLELKSNIWRADRTCHALSRSISWLLAVDDTIITLKALAERKSVQRWRQMTTKSPFLLSIFYKWSVVDSLFATNINLWSWNICLTLANVDTLFTNRQLTSIMIVDCPKVTSLSLSQYLWWRFKTCHWGDLCLSREHHC